jgi:hypothetical protein
MFNFTLETLVKMIENSYNNVPLGYHYHETEGKGKLLKLIKIFSIEETSLAEDMAELGRRMKLTDAAANITVQVSASRPEKCEGRRYAQGECCCQDHCKWSEHHTARVKMVDMVDAVLKAVEVIDIHEPEIEDLGEEASTWGLGGLFASIQLDVEAVLGQRSAPAPCSGAGRWGPGS